MAYDPGPPRAAPASFLWRRVDGVERSSRPAHAIEQVSHPSRRYRAPRHRRRAGRSVEPCFRHFWRSPDMCSCGFCLLNTAAARGGLCEVPVWAARAVPEQSKVLRKVAIIDFDVHHGNGTEEIVKSLQASQSTKTIT